VTIQIDSGLLLTTDNELLTICAPIAQLDRASDFESEGRRFESCWVHHPFLRTRSGLALGLNPEGPLLFTAPQTFGTIASRRLAIQLRRVVFPSSTRTLIFFFLAVLVSVKSVPVRAKAQAQIGVTAQVRKSFALKPSPITFLI
jgi:hypothetical protein